MRHDADLLERLSAFPTETFDGFAYRATRQSLDPLAFSLRGGRWAPAGEMAVLYTSLERNGALAEIAYHWGQLSPPPSKPVVLHRLRAAARKSLRLIRTDLPLLGVDLSRFGEVRYDRTQEIGAAVAFIGCDGLLAPSARWDCMNLILFNDNPQDELRVVETETVDWQQWARDHGMAIG
jgi:hypothetical protein